MWIPVGRLKRLARACVNRVTRRRSEKVAASRGNAPRSTRSPLVFEALEPRLLLAADPLGLAAAYAFDETSGTAAAAPSAMCRAFPQQ